MRFFAQLLTIATAITGAVAQYDDGYENVTTATTPVQIVSRFRTLDAEFS